MGTSEKLFPLRLIFAVAVLVAVTFLSPQAFAGGALALPLIGATLLNEKRLPLAEVARRLEVSLPTVWRWAMKGVRNVKLETQVWGSKRYTTEAALERFSERCTQAANGESAPQARTPRRREYDINRAERELGDEGF